MQECCYLYPIFAGFKTTFYMEIEKKERIYPYLRTCMEEQVRIKKEEGKERTAGNYFSAWKKLETYLGGQADYFSLTDLSPEVAKDFMAWMARSGEPGLKALSLGTQDFYLRNLKIMYKKAAEQTGLPVCEQFPFHGLRVKVPSTRKRALPEQSVKHLTTLVWPDCPHIMSALHLALFLFYARGMCFIDAFYLEVKNIQDGYIHYIRRKTGIMLEVKITPEMAIIIDLYHRPDISWVFPFLHEKIQGKGEITPQSALHRINYYLKKIGRQLGFPHPLTTYVMRHSWASMMLEADSGLGVISQSLGHSSLRTTEIYLGRLSTNKIDKAADSMLDNLIRPAKKKKDGTPQKDKKTPAKLPATDEKSTSLCSVISTRKLSCRCKKLISSLFTKIRLK